MIIGIIGYVIKAASGGLAVKEARFPSVALKTSSALQEAADHFSRNRKSVFVRLPRGFALSSSAEKASLRSDDSVSGPSVEMIRSALCVNDGERVGGWGGPSCLRFWGK